MYEGLPRGGSHCAGMDVGRREGVGVQKGSGFAEVSLAGGLQPSEGKAKVRPFR